MFTPSYSILALGIALAALLMVADWFVWGLTYTNRKHRGRTIPGSLSDLADGFLNRLVEVNESVLPCAALKALHEKRSAGHGDDDGGFKHVA
ncbi:MAG TPA: hypothetical protein VJ718_06425 [Candidatus Binataceae bacterium]|nr:hypothetical protein [Candidatus Binataceae bacterium]